MNRKKIKVLVIGLFLFGVAMSVFTQTRNPLANTKWKCYIISDWYWLTIEFTETSFIYMTSSPGAGGVGVYKISGETVTTTSDEGVVWTGRLIGDTLYYHGNQFYRVK